MTTALDMAAFYLAQTASLIDSPPAIQVSQVGLAVIGCESIMVAATSIQPYIDPIAPPGSDGRCFPPQLVTLVIDVARNYVCTQTKDGMDKPEDIMALSAVSQADAEAMWNMIYDTDHFLGPSNVSCGWAISGGLIVASCQFTTGVGFV